MALFQDVSSALTVAMKARDAARVTALRNIRAGFIEAQKVDNAAGVSDERCIEVLRRLAKMRQESIEAFDAGGRAEMAAAERAELAVIASFLPAQASEAQTEVWAKAAITETGAASARDMGKVMGALSKAHKDALDMKVARAVVERLLAG